MSWLPFVRAALCCAGFLLSSVAWAQESFIGRPVYSEPGVGLQMPPGCQTEAPWRSRIGGGDLEVWIVQCKDGTRTWLIRRSVLEVLGNNQARLRFQILDERSWPGETPGDSASVQCASRKGGEGGYIVLGAKWRGNATELRLAGAQAAIRADAVSQKFVAALVADIDCVRYPEREAMLRRLQHQGNPR